MSFKNYYMWWQQSLTRQSLQYSTWKKSQRSFKGRNHKEATRKMNFFVGYAGLIGRFLCVEEGCELTTTGEEIKSHIEQILESAMAYPKGV